MSNDDPLGMKYYEQIEMARWLISAMLGRNLRQIMSEERKEKPDAARLEQLLRLERKVYLKEQELIYSGNVATQLHVIKDYPPILRAGDADTWLELSKEPPTESGYMAAGWPSTEPKILFFNKTGFYLVRSADEEPSPLEQADAPVWWYPIPDPRDAETWERYSSLPLIENTWYAGRENRTEKIRLSIDYHFCTNGSGYQCFRAGDGWIAPERLFRLPAPAWDCPTPKMHTERKTIIKEIIASRKSAYDEMRKWPEK